MSETCQLLEVCAGSSSPLKIDRDKCTVFGVKILGERSLNPPPDNNSYPPETRQRAATLLEGARCNVNHAPKNQQGFARPYQDTFGTHTNIRETGDGLYSDFKYNPKHPLTEQFLWDAEHSPQNVGFSIATNGKRVQKNGQWIVEEIQFDRNRHSIDLVGRGATTSTLFESARMPVMKKISELIEELKGTRPGYVRGLREVAESGIMSPDYQAAGPSEPAADAPAPTSDAGKEVDHEQAIIDAAKAVLDSSLSTPEKIAKIKKLLGILDAGNGGGSKSSSDSPPADAKTDEALRTELATFKARDLVRTKADAAGVKVSAALMAAIRPNITDAEVTALVEELKGGSTATAIGVQKPKSAAPWQQPSGNGTPATKDGQPIQEAQKPTPAGPGNTDEARAQRVAARRMGR